jgi:mono/diheme cytochrome c family protein
MPERPPSVVDPGLTHQGRRPGRIRKLLVGLPWVALSVLGWVAVAAPPESPPSVDFNLQIRPILSQNCFFCHGPDEQERKGGRKASGGLRLDTLAGQRQDLGGRAAVVPSNPDASHLLERLVTTDPDEVMPPPRTGKRVSPEQAELIRRWIAEGARFSTHWSYERPVRPALPPVRNPAWTRNGIDRFILARLEREGLAPQPEADRRTLARRLALDLTGLPPTIEEVDAFVADPAPEAYDPLRRHPPRQARLRRALGADVARSGPVRRLRGVRGRSAAHHLALPRLR